MLHNTAPSPSLNLKPIRYVLVNEMICPFTHLMDCMTLTKHSQADESKGKQTEHMQIST
jgi:hypothetical protein